MPERLPWAATGCQGQGPRKPQKWGGGERTLSWDTFKRGFSSLWWEHDSPSMRLEADSCLGPGAGAHTAQTKRSSPTDKNGSAWLRKCPTPPTPETPLSRFRVGLQYRPQPGAEPCLAGFSNA